MDYRVPSHAFITAFIADITVPRFCPSLSAHEPFTYFAISKALTPMSPVIPLRFETVVSQPFEENTYILFREQNPDCLVVDPGLEPGLIIEFLKLARLVPTMILNTHGHSDHIAGNAVMKEIWPDAPLMIGSGDADKLLDPVKNLSAPFGFQLVSPPADRLLREGDLLDFAGTQWEVFETPGHSSGHIIFLCRDCRPWIVLGGDVLFQGSIGRTDFPDGNQDQLIHSIQTRLFTLPDDTLVLPGHGPTTTIGDEKLHNPYVGESR